MEDSVQFTGPVFPGNSLTNAEKTHETYQLASVKLSAVCSAVNISTVILHVLWYFNEHL